MTSRLWRADAGAVTEIRGAPGDKVKAGEALIILEAMKMEVKVATETGGGVKRIAAADKVDAKDILVELE